MKNIAKSIIYAVVGGILGTAVSLALIILLADYFMLDEIAMVYMIYISPVVIISGIILGAIYAKKYQS